MKLVTGAGMPHMLWLVTTAQVILSYPALVQAANAVSGTVSSPPLGCPTKCGDVDIPYPFGIGDNCSWPGQDYFTITCNNSFSPPRPYTGNVEITNISAETGEMRVFTQASYVCYDSENTTEPSRVLDWSLNSTDSPFLISPTQNVFTAIGCNTEALLIGRGDWSYKTGCITSCVSIDEAAKDGDSCTGLGCCQTAIQGNLSFIDVPWDYYNSTNPAWKYSPCSYAFVAYKDWYNFSQRDLVRNGNDSFINRVGERTIPLVLDWAFRSNGSCQFGTEASGIFGEPQAPACVSAHSHCVGASQGDGYLCNKCSKGYEGNPYISGGCTNINECTDPRYSNITAYGPCGMNSICKDADGDYNCKCKQNHKGDGKSEKGCYDYIFPPYAMAALATFAAIVLACAAVTLLQRRNLRKIFNKNGGKILASQGITTYTKRQIDNITKGYKKRLGGGNFGVVYQGRINGPPAQLVAVKCAVAAKVARNWQKIIQYVVPQNEQQYQEEENGFVNEIIFQFHIRHTNVVKLIGCCLETHIPILVFELVSNGSLHDALHTVKPCTLSLLKRLDIAIGSAEALTHIHSHGDHVHGDMKPANILLDKDLEPKVSDFGSSKLLSIDRYARAVATDRRYTDPVYIKTDRFTVKSDVYSFGIVLLEIITRKTAKYDQCKSLPLEFVKCFKDEGSRRAMYDREIFSGDDAEPLHNMKCLDMVGMLAVRCLKEDVEERPTMAEVLEELKQVKIIGSGAGDSSCS